MNKGESSGARSPGFSLGAAAVAAVCAAFALLAYSELGGECLWQGCLFSNTTQAAGVLVFCLVGALMALLLGWPRRDDEPGDD